MRVQAPAREIAELIGADERAGVAVVEAPRQPPTRIARYHGLWGHSPLGRTPASASTWALDSGRQAGVAWVPQTLLPAVIEFVASCRAAFLVLAGRADGDSISRSDLARGFDESSEALDWGEILVDAVEGGWTPVRVLRDEFGLEAQVFDTPERLARWDLS